MEPKTNLPASPSDTAITRTPAHVAADINAVKSHASAVFRAAVDEGKRSCILIGKLLEEAKSLVPHGEWGAWLKNNVDYSESTAQNLMRCYREFGDEQIDFFSGVSDADFFSILTQSQMLELLALPKDQRREFVDAHREEIEDGSLSTRQMREEIDKLKREAAAKDEELEAAREEGNADAETAAEAAARIAELEKSLKMANPAVSEFRGLFEAANSLIVALKSKLETVRCTDPEAAAKLDKAMAALAAMITRKEATT